MFNKDFYPTAPHLVRRMKEKIKGNPENILEPSAGKGDIIDTLIDDEHCHGWGSRFGLSNFSAIEIDEELQATLRGKGIKVIDSDFLTYSGPDKYDLIIANPPFSNGDEHLLKAIDILYRGEIVFLLNAETIRNPYTNKRKELKKKLSELNAEIDFIQGAFETAERPTGVEVALVYIRIERNIEDDLFAGVEDIAEDPKPGIEQNYELSTGKTIAELVAEYNQIVQIGTDTIVNYFRNYKKIGAYIGLNMEAGKDYSTGDMTERMQKHLNELVVTLRKTFWRRTLDIGEVSSRLTAKKQCEFEHQLNERSYMDFTEGNVRQFILNLIAGHEKSLTEAVLEIFDKFTIRHCYSGGLFDENIHLFNGWKTNKAFRVNKKVIIPIYAGYGDGPFISWGKWKLDYNAARQLRDVDVVMNYFDGMPGYVSISQALEKAFERGLSAGIESTYFRITAYKKGTIHLTFRDDNILRRFNVAACKGKGWLPQDYGSKKYQETNPQERAVIDSFEGQESYAANLMQPLFGAATDRPRLAHTEADEQQSFLDLKGAA